MPDQDLSHNLLVDVQVATTEAWLPEPEKIQDWAFHIVNSRVSKDTEVTIRIVDVNEISTLNKDYRGKDKPTNVLSFPMNEVIDSVNLLGDVVICAEILKSEALDANIELEAHWAHIVTHGLLHLLGYDHQNDEQADEMEQLESKILTNLGYSSPYF